jgi:hypothetical protein
LRDYEKSMKEMKNVANKAKEEYDNMKYVCLKKRFEKKRTAE